MTETVKITELTVGDVFVTDAWTAHVQGIALRVDAEGTPWRTLTMEVLTSTVDRTPPGKLLELGEFGTDHFVVRREVRPQGGYLTCSAPAVDLFGELA